jgi:hypothetical protein
MAAIREIVRTLGRSVSIKIDVSVFSPLLECLPVFQSAQAGFFDRTVI